METGRGNNYHNNVTYNKNKNIQISLKFSIIITIHLAK